MDDIITNVRIRLEKAHVKGIPEYIKKLQDNSSSPNFEDFRLEGEAAIMFSKADFCVTLRESPDLALKFNSEQFYAEVKHFRLKRQDQIVNTVPPAWKQVYDVAKKKIKQYKEHVSNILVIGNNDDCIEELDIPKAISMIKNDIRSGKCPGFAKLNGILFISLDWYNISQRREVYFYHTRNPAVSLSRELFFLLYEIRLG